MGEINYILIISCLWMEAIWNIVTIFVKPKQNLKIAKELLICILLVITFVI